MKKILFTLLGLFIGAGSLQAQCVPDTTINDILVPPAGSTFDTINGEAIVILPYAQVNQSYNAAMHFKIPKDTTYLGIQGTVDSVRLLEIRHLPTSFTLGCNTPRCSFLGGEYGCAYMTGTPTQPDSVELEVVIEYTVRIGNNSAPLVDTLGGFYLVISGPMSLEESALAEKLSPRIYPNPARDHINVALGDWPRSEVQFEVFNMVGQTVLQSGYSHRPGLEKRLELNDLKSGVYLYRVSARGKSHTGRFSLVR